MNVFTQFRGQPDSRYRILTGRRAPSSFLYYVFC